MRETNLAYDDSKFAFALGAVRHLALLQRAIVGNPVDVFEVLGHRDAREVGVFLLGLEDPSEVIPDLPGIDHAVSAAGGYDPVVARPEQVSHSSVVTLERPRLGLASVGVKYLNGLVVVGAVHGGEILSSVRELDLFAGFERYLFEVLDLVVVQDDAHHLKLVLETHDQE